MAEDVEYIDNNIADEVLRRLSQTNKKTAPKTDRRSETSRINAVRARKVKLDKAAAAKERREQEGYESDESDDEGAIIIKPSKGKKKVATVKKPVADSALEEIKAQNALLLQLLKGNKQTVEEKTEPQPKTESKKSIESEMIKSKLLRF